MKNLKVKTIILIAAIGLISYNTMAQKTQNMVPQAVITTFSAKYPQAQLKGWQTKNNACIASFAIANKKYKASFSNDGRWISTETQVKRSSPQILAYLKKNNYASWYVDKIEKVETPMQSMYQVQIDNNSGNPTSYSNAGAIENKMLCFDDNGKLIKVVNN